MVIAVIGAGYVGLVTGTVFADFGHTVWCVDIDSAKIDLLKKGKTPFYEPGLEELVKRNYDQMRLFFTTKYQDAIAKAEAVFICVGTPPLDNGEANVDYLISAVKETAKHLRKFTLIVIKSTVPIGIEKELSKIIAKTSKADFEFASCPEFLKEGSAVEDARSPDRIVIGTNSKRAEQMLLNIYKPFPGQRLICDLTSAQMIKYTSNTLLATKISFANAIANLSERLGADAEVVLKGTGMDKRIGSHFLKPGVGYGGSCFPKDISAFRAIAKTVGYDFKLLEAVEDINHQQINFFLDKVEKAVGPLAGKTLAVLGLAFKPDTDDIREAPAIEIIQQLLKRKVRVKAYDPLAANNARKVLGNTVSYISSSYLATEGAHALLVLTEWNEFRELDLTRIKKLMKKPIIIDGRNIYDASTVRNLGFTYYGVGKA